MKVKENDLPVLAVIAARRNPTTAELVEALKEQFDKHTLYARLCDMDERGLIVAEREPVVPYSLRWKLTPAGTEVNRTAPGVIAGLQGGTNAAD